MDHNEFPSASKYSGPKNAAPEPQEEEAPKAEKIITGSVVRRKKSFGRKAMEHVFGGADGGSVFSYVGQEILLPALRDMISDAVIGTTERTLGLDRGPGRRSGGYRPSRGGPIAYDRYSGSPARNEPRREVSPRGRATHDFEEILFETRAEAEEVRDRLWHYTEKYGRASVSYFYDLVGTESSYTDQKYGWFEGDLANTKLHRARGGRWLIDLPPTSVLD